MTNPLNSISFLTLFNATADGILMVDDFDHIVQANQAAQLMLSYTEAEITGLAVENIIAQSHREHYQNIKAACSTSHYKHRQSNRGERFIVLTQNHKELFADIKFNPILTETHNFLLVILHIVDKRQQAEEALRASEDKLYLARRTAGLAIFDFDTKSDTIHCDEPMHELWGIPLTETITYEKLLAGIHPADRHIWQDAILQAINPENTGGYRAEYRVINATNHGERWVFTIGTVFFAEGKATRFLGVVQDITERKLLERNLQKQSIAMEYVSKQQVAAQTASAIAHELNQPLAAISAYSEVALHALTDYTGDKDKLRRALEGCVAQAQRAGHSLHELLEFLQNGEFTKEPIHLHNVIRQALATVNHGGYGGFQPILKLEPNLPTILGNSMQVQKVIINLILNGIEAMHVAGVCLASINVEAFTVIGSNSVNKIDMTNANMVQVTIQDNGPGLDIKTSKRIFEPFFTTKAKGIGMGLSISRALIEANGGQLWMDMNATSGAKFHFTLPVATCNE